MKTRHWQAKRRRAQGAVAAVVVLTGALGLAFFRVQVLRSSTYVLQARSNRLRALPVPAPRGTIFDRDGHVIADNVPGWAVTVLYERRDSVEATLERLKPYLDLDEEDIARAMRTVDRYPRQPLIVDRDVDFEAVSRLEERRADFPNVFVEMRPKRRYAGQGALFHVIGYIGEITREELQSNRYAQGGYEQGMSIGKSGIEEEYEDVLQGARGVRYVEVDARGRVVGDFGGSVVAPGVGGGSIQLNLDLELQQWIHSIFPHEKSGAVVALDPADGGVLALYSWPAADPNDFVGGLDSQLLSRLNADPGKPFHNRAVTGRFPPASTFKPVVAAIALDLGLVSPEDRMRVSCDGGLLHGGRYVRCWNSDGHGRLNLTEAIGHSCDVYFYQLGLMIGLDGLIERGNALGLTRRCGIDLPGEREGVFPESRDYWQRVFGYRPLEGEVLSLSIGQGPNSQTPLKVAQFYLALARDGSAPAPSLLRGRDSEEGWHLDLDQRHLAEVRRGLRYVTSPEGTAYRSSLEHWDLIGKTGTGENALSQQGQGDTDAWFAGMAGPRSAAPEIVVVALVEQGGGGSSVAAPLAAKTADFYLRRKYGIPVDSVQTLGEHLARGRPVWLP